MKKILSLATILIAACSFSQNFKVTDYPKGVYETYEDFRIKTPSVNPNLSAPISTDQVAFRFDDLDNKGKKLKKAFAISDGKDLYIQVVNVVKKFNSEDKGQGYDGGVYYLKAENKGGYLFMKDYFTSNSAAMWGGLIAAASARRLKGVIFEEEKESFNLFKNLDDFKTFMEVNYPDVELSLERGKGEEKIDEVEVVENNLDKIIS